MTHSARPPVQPRHRPGWRVVTTAIAGAAVVGAALIAPHLTGHGATELAAANMNRDTGGTAAGTGGTAAGSSGTAAGTGCPDVEVVFARGTGEAPGLGAAGTALLNALQADLPGKMVSSYAVNYDASFTQVNVGRGATDMSNHIISVAAQCPGTRFVIGGYSQGASVVDVAIGIMPTLGPVTTIPASRVSDIAAVVVFGNPLGDLGQTIASLSPVYGPESDSFCNAGDPVCARGFNLDAHLAYATDGSAVRAAQFAAGELDALTGTAQ